MRLSKNTVCVESGGVIPGHIPEFTFLLNLLLRVCSAHRKPFFFFFSTKSTESWNWAKVNSWPLSCWSWSMKSCRVSQQLLKLSRLQGQLMVMGSEKKMQNTCLILPCFYICLLEHRRRININTEFNLKLKAKVDKGHVYYISSTLQCKTALARFEIRSHTTV